VFNHGDMYRDFTYIDDIIAGVVACLDHPPADDGAQKAGGSVKPHALYNIGNSRSEPLMKVIGLLEEACGRKAELDMLPMQPGDVPDTFAATELLAALTGIRPATPVREGVARLVAWYRDFYRV